ncbi:MAG TPA: YbaB/EbfC family nucleoid-associated protein [Candidatus Acidoferrum sp.]|nr:YbaB/EbfC family nucleoid-associated protein [Candidatus Acidoferrum sp.]
MFDKAKMAMQVRKAQKELANEIMEAEAGDGAVKIRITGEQKIKKVVLDPEKIDFDDMPELERWIESAIKEAITKSQQFATEKMKPLMGALGKLGL